MLLRCSYINMKKAAWSRGINNKLENNTMKYRGANVDTKGVSISPPHFPRSSYYAPWLWVESPALSVLVLLVYVSWVYASLVYASLV